MSTSQWLTAPAHMSSWSDSADAHMSLIWLRADILNAELIWGLSSLWVWHSYDLCSLWVWRSYELMMMINWRSYERSYDCALTFWTLSSYEVSVWALYTAIMTSMTLIWSELMVIMTLIWVRHEDQLTPIRLHADVTWDFHMIILIPQNFLLRSFTINKSVFFKATKRTFKIIYY